MIYFAICELDTNNEILEKYTFIKDLLFNDVNNYKIYKEDLENLKNYRNSNFCCQDLKQIDYNLDKLKKIEN